MFKIKNREKLTKLYMRRDIVLVTSVFEVDINPWNCACLPGFMMRSGMENTGTNLQTLQDKELNLLLEKNFRGGISSVMGDRYLKSD